MSDLTLRDVDKAIECIEDSKKTHVVWRDWLSGDPERGRKEVPLIRGAGDIDHHDQCIVEYNHVLSVLNTVRALLTRLWT